MKKNSFAILVAISLLFLQAEQNPSLNDILGDNWKLEKLADGFQFTEGPASDQKGDVFFTDQPTDRILKWDDQAGRFSVFMHPSGRSNGLAFDKKGNLWSCADQKNELWSIAPSGSIEKVESLYKGKALNGPNDLWPSPDGGVYYTDPYYKRDWWDHNTMPQPLQGVYYLAPDHKKITCVAADLVQPNGIVGTPDGRYLFVADIAAGKTWKYEILKDASLGPKKLFCEMGSDGMTIDNEGNIYLTGNGVTIFGKDGSLIGNIPVPESWTANVCFGGKDCKSLFITASKGFYSLRTKIAGPY